MARWRKNERTDSGLLICGNGLHTYDPELNECPACKEARNRKATSVRIQAEKEAKERGEEIRTHRKKQWKPSPYEPDPHDSAVKRARSERKRVLKMRLLHGPEWYKKVA